MYSQFMMHGQKNIKTWVNVLLKSRSYRTQYINQ